MDLGPPPDLSAEALPYGVFSTGGQRPRIGVRVGGGVLDLAAALGDDVWRSPTLEPLLVLGPSSWRAARATIVDALGSGRAAPHLRSLDGVQLHLPFRVADYADFYSSRHHADNCGRILRPGGPALPPNWHHLPVGYHGRAGTVVVSGTPVVRPCGQHRDATGAVRFGPSTQLDFEAEVGFVIGVPSGGEQVGADAFDRHVFGVVLLNDWSARDVQAWEGQPLGPFLGKSFATSISAWVTPLDALRAARRPTPPQDPAPLPHLAETDGWALDLALEVARNGRVISRPPFSSMYWTPSQQVAHLTSNGTPLRTGDLIGSGTVSGPAHDQWGSLLELTWGGREGSFLLDGDRVTISATAPAVGGGRLTLGPVAGQVLPAAAR